MDAPFQVIDVSIPMDDDESMVKKHILSRIRPSWQPEDVVCKLMQGGFVNVMKRYSLRSDAELKDAVVVRCFNPSKITTSSTFSRLAEFLGMQVAQKAGVGAAVLATFNNGLVLSFIHGRIIDSADFSQPAIAKKVAWSLGRFNNFDVTSATFLDVRGNPVQFPTEDNFFQLIYQSIDELETKAWEPRLARRIKEELPTPSVFREEVRYIQSMVGQLGLHQGHIHRDCHGGNLMYDAKTGHVTILDFEAMASGLCVYDMTYILNTYILKSFLKNFPTTEGPASDETVRMWAEAYLRGKFEIQGRDPNLVTEKDIKLMFLEMKIIDVFTLLVFITVEFCMVPVEGDELVFRLCPPGMKAYYERKKTLPQLVEQYKHLRDSA